MRKQTSKETFPFKYTTDKTNNSMNTKFWKTQYLSNTISNRKEFLNQISNHEKIKTENLNEIKVTIK